MYIYFWAPRDVYVTMLRGALKMDTEQISRTSTNNFTLEFIDDEFSIHQWFWKTCPLINVCLLPLYSRSSDVFENKKKKNIDLNFMDVHKSVYICEYKSGND